MKTAITNIGSPEVWRRETQARVAGHLFRKAAAVLEAYHSDLYHDIRYLDEFIFSDETSKTIEFYYGVRSTGTSIGEDPDRVLPFNDRAWLVTLVPFVEDGYIQSYDMAMQEVGPCR